MIPVSELQVIALLCQLSAATPNGYSIEHIIRANRQAQEQCQKYYVICAEKKELSKCILERAE